MSGPNLPAPHTGPAQEPSTVSLEPGEGNAVTGKPFIVGDEDIKEPSAPSTPRAPAAPSVDVDALRKENEALKAQLQTSTAEINRRFEEMRLEMELRQLEAGIPSPGSAPFSGAPPVQSPRPQQPTLPEGVTLEDNVTLGQLDAVMSHFANQLTTQLNAQNQAQILRATWTVTPAQEQAVLAKYPQVQNYPEPQKTQFIQKAAVLIAPSNPSASAAPHATQTPGIPVAPVPTPETGLQPPSLEPAPQDALAQASKRYEEARNIKDPQKRKTEMFAAWKEILAIQGMDADQLVQQAWVSSS